MKAEKVSAFYALLDEILRFLTEMTNRLIGTGNIFFKEDFGNDNI